MLQSLLPINSFFCDGEHFKTISIDSETFFPFFLQAYTQTFKTRHEICSERTIIKIERMDQFDCEFYQSEILYFTLKTYAAQIEMKRHYISTISGMCLTVLLLYVLVNTFEQLKKSFLCINIVLNDV